MWSLGSHRSIEPAEVLLGSVRDIEVTTAGIYVSGSFNRASGQNAPGLALWTGTKWEPIEHPADDPYRVAVADGDLYIVGDNPNPNQYDDWVFRRRNGSWSRVGSVAAPNSLSLPYVHDVHPWGQDSLIFAGDFGDIDGVTQQSIAVLVGDSWDSAGVNVSGRGAGDIVLDAIRTVETAGDTLFVAGDFNSLGDGPSQRIGVIISGQTTPLGDGLGDDGSNDRVYDLLHSDEGLYAAGRFDSSGATRLNNVGLWNGTQWLALGDGLGSREFDRIESIAMSKDGILYAGGTFTDNLTGAAGLAMWNGSTWAALSGPPNGGVQHVAIDSLGHLIVAGRFDSVGTVAANSIARWDGTNWHAIDGGLTIATQVEDHRFRDELRISVYPNPATREVTVELSGADQVASIVIADVVGRIVRRNDVTGSQMVLDLSHFASGLYFVRVESETQSTVTTIVKVAL